MNKYSYKQLYSQVIFPVHGKISIKKYTAALDKISENQQGVATSAKSTPRRNAWELKKM